eukprot:TRINITY_DN29907_c0_g1_i1.p1 TRINITY_DN29907_c0_g1~~TRINITY_DN29907_c0_g1_i1.p1  ORF type:complete len:331 (+),score=104.69 TRINITY_DN29907_c0_g1_i1:63-1055(+)
MADKVKELALFAAVHAAASKVLTKDRAARLLGDGGANAKDVERRRVLWCCAAALAAVAPRWGADTRTLMVALLLGKYVDLFKDAYTSDKAYVASWFFPLAACMWTRLPQAAGKLDTCVHPNFTSTMVRLLGFPSKADAVRFGRDPITYYKGWGVGEHVAVGVRGFKWAFKALLTAYAVQALVAWASGRGKEDGEKRSLAGLLNQLKHALGNTLRTCAVYQVCASWSNVAYSFTGNEPNFIYSFPVMAFLAEPLGRLKTMCLFYFAHLNYYAYQRARYALQAPAAGTAANAAMRGVNQLVVAVGLPAMMLAFAGSEGSEPPLYGGLKKITL